MISLKIFRDLINIDSKLIRLQNNQLSFIEDYIWEVDSINYISKYTYVLNNRSSNLIKNINTSYYNKIWQFWYQGIDEVPRIVRKCLDSVQKYSGNREVIFLQKKNIDKFVSIPGYVYDKKEKGYISNALFSDILRVCLLDEYGGSWLDSTILLTDPIPDYVYNSPLFCFSITPKEIRGMGNIYASSWFIHSSPNHIIINSIKNLFFEYWKYEIYSRHYYLFHLLFSLAISTNEECKKEWNKVPFFSNVPPHILQMELFNSFTEERFEQIKQMSSIHKLTYYDFNNSAEENKNSFYNVLLNMDI